MAPTEMSRSNSQSSISGSPTTTAMPPAPGGPIEIVFSFDTTGSMGHSIQKVKNHLQDLIQRLTGDIPNLRIAVCAHGDYCDKATYITNWLDFTRDSKELCSFVKNVASTWGGDWPEAYELMLRETRIKCSWTDGSQRALVVVGDAVAHEKDDNPDKIDWKEETQHLRDMGVRIYGVRAPSTYKHNGPTTAKMFYEYLASTTGGRHLTLEQFPTIIDMLLAICYREHGVEFFDAYEHEVRMREGVGIRNELDNMFTSLRPDKLLSPINSITSLKDAAASKKKEKVTKKLTGAAKKPLVVKKVKSPVKRLGTAKVVKQDKKKLKKMVTKTTKPKIYERKELRENVTQSDFALNSLKWSNWQLAMSASKPKSTGLVNPWSPRRHGHVGYRQSQLFKENTRDNAIYEFAVQTHQGKKRHPMYCRLSNGYSDKPWDTYLLRHRNVVTQVDRVLKKGCKIYARKGKLEPGTKVGGVVMNSVAELRKFVCSTYDYAWNKTHFGKDRHRRVEKSGKLISNCHI